MVEVYLVQFLTWNLFLMLGLPELESAELCLCCYGSWRVCVFCRLELLVVGCVATPTAGNFFLFLFACSYLSPFCEIIVPCVEFSIPFSDFLASQVIFPKYAYPLHIDNLIVVDLFSRPRALIDGM